jgi:hypothetical protein
MKGFISIGTTIVIIYIVSFFAIALSFYSMYQIRLIQISIEKPVTGTMVITPLPTIEITATETATPSVFLKSKIIAPTVIKAN